VRPYAHIDDHGHHTSLPRDNDWGSLTYMNYGLVDRFTVGMVPHFGYRRPVDGRGSSGVGLGDVTVQAQYRLTKWEPGHWTPTTAINVSESLPIGDFDRLGDRPADGFGSGAFATTFSVYSQTYLWAPSGRIVRTRLDVSYTVSDDAKPKDVSVYGTPAGFRGRAQPGDTLFADLAFEYSVTRNWVLALDLGYERDGATTVSGAYPDPLAATALRPFQGSSGPSKSLIIVPAVEYNFTPAVGVIIGARFIPDGRNTTASITPVIALNYVL
jgi:hypothetical protein